MRLPVLVLPPPAWRPLLAVAAGVGAVLVAVSPRYGYHRDELYFLAAGRHLAWGYPDQPPFTPLVARAVTAVAGDSLVALRTPSALAAGAMVVLTGLIARELGGGRPAQLLAAASVGASAVVLLTGHLLSTSTFDLLAWTALTLLVVRALRTGDDRLWLLAGVVAGVGLLNKTLVVFLLAAVAGGLLLSGPRRVLRSGWLWGGVGLALAIWAPNLWWQAQNGWPQLDLSRSIAEGSSGTSASRVAFLPYQLVLIGPALVPVWAAGLVRLFRAPDVRFARSLGWAYVLLAFVFVATGGKPYYLCGLYPVLLAAGAKPVTEWASGRTARTRLVYGTVAVSAVIAGTLMLPVLPVAWLRQTPIPAINYDGNETVGWPQLAATVAAAHNSLPEGERASAVVLTGNYGQAGAVDRFGPELRLPPAYSGHNGYHDWGPPPSGAGPVLAIGIDEAKLRTLFGSVEAVARVDNGVQLDNDEQGGTVWLCRGQRGSWSSDWPNLRRLG